jgi:DNA polymerase III beta subunit, N-terminal domain
MVERKTAILTLSNLLIEVKGSRLSITATDLELSSHLVRSEPKKQGAGTVSQRKYAAPQRRGTRSGYQNCYRNEHPPRALYRQMDYVGVLRDSATNQRNGTCRLRSKSLLAARFSPSQAHDRILCSFEYKQGL